MLQLVVRFPLGIYHAQSVSDFREAEWPPHPVRVIAALVAAAHARPHGDLQAAQVVIDRLSASPPPRIVAPRAAGLDQADGVQRLARLRGASRWAPRNHELAELTGGKGISPRDLGRGRAEVHKVGVAVGELPVVFEWRDLDLDSDARSVLGELVDEVTVLGTARSPVVLELAEDAEPAEADTGWSPGRQSGRGATSVRVPTARTPDELDAWHARRAAPLRRDGSPPPAPYVPPAALGETRTYRHDLDVLEDPVEPLDPRWWGDLIVLALDPENSEALPRSSSTFAFARAARKALLNTFGEEGGPDEAPPVLRGRGGNPHAAFVPLSFVREAVPGPRGPDTVGRGEGRTLGLAVLLPHAARVKDVSLQRAEVERGLRALLLDPDDRGLGAVHVPAVGTVRLRLIPGARRMPEALREARYRGPSRHWSTVTPLVHSRYQARRGAEGLREQVAADCRDVGLPEPAWVRLRRVARFRGAPQFIGHRGLPDSWTGPLRGPQAHLDLGFEREVVGPLLLGRARHFGLGLCLPFTERSDAAETGIR